MAHRLSCPTRWEPDAPCNCGESGSSKRHHNGCGAMFGGQCSCDEYDKWESSHQLDDGILNPTSHSPDCPARWEPDQRCTCGYSACI